MRSIFCRSMGPPKSEAFSKQDKGSHMGARCIKRSLQKRNLKSERVVDTPILRILFPTSMVCPCCCLFCSGEPQFGLQQRFFGWPFSGKTLRSWRRSWPNLATTRTGGGLHQYFSSNNLSKGKYVLKNVVKKNRKTFLRKWTDHRPLPQCMLTTKVHGSTNAAIATCAASGPWQTPKFWRFCGGTWWRKWVTC